jgi:hypothetical protein
MSSLGGRVSLAAVSLASLVSGAILLAVGSVLRQQQTVAAGKRRFHGQAFERRWIPDEAERERHAAVVAERLGISGPPRPVVRVTEAATGSASAPPPCVGACTGASWRPSSATAA